MGNQGVVPGITSWKQRPYFLLLGALLTKHVEGKRQQTQRTHQGTGHRSLLSGDQTMGHLQPNVHGAQ